MTPQGHSLSILTPHPPHALGFLYYSWLLFFLNLHFLINSYFLDWISHCLSKNIYVPKTIVNKKIIFFFLLETKRWNKNEKVACLDVILKPKDSYWSFPGALKPRSKRGLKWIYKTYLQTTNMPHTAQIGKAIPERTVTNRQKAKGNPKLQGQILYIWCHGVFFNISCSENTWYENNQVSLEESFPRGARKSMISLSCLLWKHILKPDPCCLKLEGTFWFPGGSDSKESACNVGDLSLIPGSASCPAKGHGNPLQYSCLENPRNRGAWRATVHRVSKSRTQLSDFTFTFFLNFKPCLEQAF